VKPQKRLPYILEINDNGSRWVGPFDNDLDARDYGCTLRDPRWHLLHCTPDEVREPLSVIAPRHAAQLQRYAREMSASMARAGVS
jgi:hypothetical protein